MKKHVFLSIILSMIMLTGCGSLDEYISEKITEKSGVLQDENYIKYEEYKNSGMIDEDGLYINDETIEEKAGNVHISFASNNNLKTNFYLDSLGTDSIEAFNFYTNSGSSIYAKTKLSDDIRSSVYEFAGYNIYSYSPDNKRKLVNYVEANVDEITEIMIPSDDEITEYSIEPVGKYGTVKLSFADYLLGDDDSRTELSSEWFIDDKSCNEDKTAEISPISSCIISCKYDSDEYFFISSEPESYYNNNEDGLVIFPQREATDTDTTYSIDLHKYIEVSIPIDHSRKIAVNGEPMQQYQSDSSLDLKKLVYGDYVKIETDSEWMELEQNRELILSSTENKSGSYIYTLMLPEKGGEFLFDPSEYSYEHGSFEFKCFGSVVNAPQMLKKGSKIYYDLKSVDEGYWLSKGTHCIVVGEEAETRDALNKIHFSPMVQVTVELKQPDFGGHIEYSVDGKRVYSNTVSTYSGKVIGMKISHWEGWMCDIDSTQYVVKDDSVQCANINGKDVNSLFKEDDWHKPVLTIVLDDSVGAEMMVNVEASGVSKTDKSYAEGWFKMRTDYTLVNKEKIGTEKGIVLSLSNSAIPKGKALKIQVNKSQADSKNIEKKLIYVDDVVNLRDPIQIYSDDEIDTTSKYYKDISINISLVDICKFRAVSPKTNTTIVVRNADTMEELKNNQFVEASQKLIVTINPDKGYYISGKKTENDVYQNTMEYSDYEEDIDSIVESHSVGKYYKITLDESDSFATYTYELDGKKVAGTVYAKENQELELDYKINDEVHELAEEKGGFFGLGASVKEETEEIKITPSLDGKTITRKDFNIRLKGE